MHWLAFLMLVALLPAQTVRVVDAVAGPVTDIQTAVNAAVDGDLILVRSGVYGPVTIDGKSLTIFADLGAQVDIEVSFAAFALSRVTIRNLSSTQRVWMRGIDMGGCGILPPFRSIFGLVCENCQGGILLEDCCITGGDEDPFFTMAREGLVSTNCQRLSLKGCTVTAGSYLALGGTCPGALMTNTQYSLYSSSFRGSDAPNTGKPGAMGPFAGGDGLSMVGGSGFASNCTFQGGSGTNGASPIFGACDGGDGGAGVRVANSGDFTFLASMLLGGSGGTGYFNPPQPPCMNGAPGNPWVAQGPGSTVTSLPGTARGFSVSGPHREAEMVSFVTQGIPGDLVVWSLSLAQDHLFLPVSNGVLVPQFPLTLLQVGSIPFTGTLSIGLTAANLPTGLDGVAGLMQSVCVSATGTLTLTNPSLLIVIDQQF